MKYNGIAIFALVIATLFTGGCATIINGTSQKVQVSSEPAGATVQIDEKASYTTPVRIRLERKLDHKLVFTKEGYESQSLKMTHVLSEVVCGNLFLGGPLGWFFDIFAGTQYKLIPNPVNVKLVPEHK